jgi:hypothetical protein
MSLMVARMATRYQLRCLTKLTWIAGASLACSPMFAFGQENALRDSDLTLTSADAQSEPTAKQDNSAKKDEPLAKTSDGARNAGGPSASRGPKASKEPLVLPALAIPNTSIQGMGTGATPEDMVSGRLPARIPLPFGQDRYGYWPLESKTWAAPVFCHQPTYFEDVMLERHGHERFTPIQPLISGARFFGDVALMPYNAYLNPPLKDIPSTGYYRPGSTAPCIRQRPTYDKGALRFQLLTTGTTFLAAQP